jgi:hypothetical protein
LNSGSKSSKIKLTHSKNEMAQALRAIKKLEAKVRDLEANAD